MCRARWSDLEKHLWRESGSQTSVLLPCPSQTSAPSSPTSASPQEGALPPAESPYPHLGQEIPTDRSIYIKQATSKFLGMSLDFTTQPSNLKTDQGSLLCNMNEITLFSGTQVPGAS